MAERYKIVCEEDIDDLFISYDGETLFKIVETCEILSLSNLLYYYDGQEITVEVL